MATDAEALITRLLRQQGGPLTVPELRRSLRANGRSLSEDFIRRTCVASAVIREVGSRFALLSQLEETGADDPEPVPTEPVSLRYLPRLRGGDYVVFDLETTGTDPVADAIVQIGAVRVRAGRPVAIFFEPVHPGGRELTAALRQALHLPIDGPMDRLIRAAPPAEAVLPRFLTFVGDDLLVAHNGVGLDVPFLQQYGLASDWSALDSLELAYLAWPEAPRHGLEALADSFGLPPGCAEVKEIIAGEARVAGAEHHNALYDAAVLHLVVARLLARLDAL